MNNQIKFANPLILFLMPILFGIGIQSLSYETRRFAVLPTGNTGKCAKESPEKQKSGGNQEFNTTPGKQNKDVPVNPPNTAGQNEGVAVNPPDAAKPNEGIPLNPSNTADQNESVPVDIPEAAKPDEDVAVAPPATSDQGNNQKTINPKFPPAIEVAMEPPPKTLPTIRFTR